MMTYPKTKQTLMMIAFSLLFSIAAKASQISEENKTESSISVDTNNTSSPVTKSPEQLELEKLRQDFEGLQKIKSSLEKEIKLGKEQSSEQQSTLEKLREETEHLRSESKKTEEELRLIQEKSLQQESDLEKLRQEMERLRSESEKEKSSAMEEIRLAKEKSLEQENNLKNLMEELKILRSKASGYSEELENLSGQVKSLSIDPFDIFSVVKGEKSLEILSSEVGSLMEKNREQQKLYTKSGNLLKNLLPILAFYQKGAMSGIKTRLELVKEDLKESESAFIKAFREIRISLKQTKALPTDYLTPLLSQLMCLEGLLKPESEINPVELKMVWGKFMELIGCKDHQL